MSKEAIYWIFSTLPQVLAALTGLVMAGLTIYDQNQKKQIDNDPTLEDVLTPLSKKISKHSRYFLIASIVTIIVDINVLAFAETISDHLSYIPILSDFELGFWFSLIYLPIILNCVSLALLFPVLNPVLNPDVLKKLKKKETAAVKKELDSVLNTSDVESDEEKADTDTDPGKKDVAAHGSGHNREEKDSKVSPLRFIEYFRKFELTVRAYFPSDSQFGKKDGMSFLVRQLSKADIIPQQYLSEILNIIRLRNLYMHQTDIGDVDVKIIDKLREITKILHERLPEYLILRGGEKFEIWASWIHKNIKDLDEAYDLDQTIRHKHRYGKYAVVFNGYNVTITPTDGNRLILPHKDENEFLRLLESWYTTETSYSIEEEKSLRDAIARINGEN